MNSRVVFVITVFICLEISGSTDALCSDDGQYSCVLNNGSVEQCISSGCNSTEGKAFRVTGNKTLFGYKRENINFTLLLEDADATNISVNISSKGEDISLQWPSGEDFKYTISNATKDDEGLYQFLASGIVDNETLYSMLHINLYVFTVDVHLEKDQYLLVKEETKQITVIVSSDAMDWSRIELFETFPHLSEAKKKLEIAVDSRTHEHRAQILTPTKQHSEGEYQFRVTEHSLTIPKEEYSTTTTITVYVHSTLLEADKTSFISDLDGNITVHLHVTTELVSLENVTVHVIKPDNTMEALDIDTVEKSKNMANIRFSVTGVQKIDYGEYEFVAVEHTGTENFGNTSFSLSTFIYGPIRASSSLQEHDGVYVSLVGTADVVNCIVDGMWQDVVWWSEGSEVSTDESKKIFQNGTGILNIASDADYSEARDFICKADAQETTVVIAVEGLSDVMVTYAEGAFTCTSRGNPLPSMSWELSGKDSLPPTMFDNAAAGAMGPFESNTTLKVIGSTVCLGDQKIVCVANNSHADLSQEIAANEGSVGVYMDKYIVLFKDKADFVKSNSTCKSNLVMVKDESKMSFVVELANAANITEFYIGAVLDESGTYVWVDGTPVSYPQIPKNDNIECAGYNLKGSEWMASAINCSKELNIVCEYTDTSSPEDLVLAPEECNGTVLKATWKASSGITQQVSIWQTDKVAETLETEELTAGTWSKTFDTLHPGTDYTVKVSAIIKYCYLHPYVEGSVTTEGLPPLRPANASIKKGENDICSLTWNYPGENPDRFWINLIVNAIIDKNEEFEPEIKVHEVKGNASSVTTDMYPNSMYSAKIWAENCVGNGSFVVTQTGCKTTVAAPPVVSHPAWYPTKDNKINTTLPKADNRAGPISCQFLVVRYADDSVNASQEMNEERFNNIKQADSGEIKTGEEYFAYATVALKSKTDILLGEGSSTSCAPLQASSARRSGEIRAWNRPIPFDVGITYFMVTSTPNEESTIAYFGMSQSSDVYYIHGSGEEGSSSNTSVIVLSILAVIVVLSIAVFLYLRCRNRKKRSNMMRSFRLSYKAQASDYDAL